MPRRQWFFRALIWLFWTPATAVASPPGALISNTASLDYLDAAGRSVTVTSNTVEVTTAVVRSPATVEFTRVVAGSGQYVEPVGPSACSQGGVFTPLADPVLTGGIGIDPAVPRDVAPAASYNLGEPLFLRLDDADQNRDFQLVETADVTVSHPASGDTERIRLTETGPDTGIFAGYVPSAGGPASPGDCVLQGSLDTVVELRYADPADAADVAAASARLDPTSVVFESRTGTAVPGAEVELVDAATGLPATVYGNDGVSLFPTVLVTGSTVTDSGGTVYAFAPGEYRFPVVPDGEYRLVVRPPAAYVAPSSATIDALQALPGAPFALGPASFGAAFTKTGDLSFAVDIPVDPRPSALFLDKRASAAVAAPGDFVRYELVLENAAVGGPVSSPEMTDHLPQGLRLVPGSVTVAGSPVPDPVPGPDGRELVFALAPLAAGERVSVTYVAQIVGGAAGDQLVNRAVAAADGGLTSNEATAVLRLTEDLQRSTGTIIGRIVEADCENSSFADAAGVAGVRVYLEDGRYAVSDEGGRFHFEGLPPGTHVAQLDTFTVPAWFDVVGCAADPEFAGRPHSQFVRLSRGSLKRADFFLRRKPRPEGRIDLELVNRGTDSADEVAYTLTLEGTGNVAIDDINLRFLLPDGVRYRAGTLQVDGRAAGEPRVSGPVLSLALDDRFGNWESEVTFVAAIDSRVSGELETRAVATFDSALGAGQETPVAVTRMLREPAVMQNEGYVLDLKFAVLSAELSPADRRELDRLIADWQGVRDIRIGVVGHSDSQPIAARNRHLFADNYALSEARARAAADYVAAALAVPAGRIQVEGRGPDDPVAGNGTASGRQANRRVEMVLSGVRPSRPSFLEVVRESSGRQVTPTLGALPGENPRRRTPEFDPDAGMPASQVEPPLESLEPGIGLLLPAEDFSPAIAATKISVRHAPGQSVKVYLNEAPINPLTFDSTVVNRARTVAVSRWKGVDLADGENVIRLVVTNPDGSRAGAFKRTIYYAGQPIRGTIVSDGSTLVADGKTIPVIAVRLFDRAGRPARTGTVGTYRVEPPYRSLWDVEDERRNALVAIGTREPTYRVGPGGIAYIELEPTSRSGEVTLALGFGQLRSQALRAWLVPAKRDWILVGFAEGTAAYQTLSDNLEAAAAAGHEDGYVDDGRVAFFAKGSIRGRYLLTLAYDSARDRAASAQRFESIIEPDRYYPLYADGSEQRFEAPSQRKLYVKLERGQFNALFGDFDTGLSVTDLARYERRLNGFRSEYRGERLGYTAFAADSAQGLQRDELRGDGTSGLYRLASAPIVANSETIRIEIRDRFDAGRVLEERVLARFLDYQLDPLEGTLFFKQPVPSRDLDFNPVYIVAEYETLAGTADELVAGGRVSLRSAADAVEVGVTRIDDSNAGAGGDLTGLDLRWQISGQTLARAEYAESDAVRSGVATSGKAHKIELEHNGENVDLEAYIREVDDGFGLGLQSAADRGFRRLGLDLRGRLGERVQVDATAGWQQDLATEDIRHLATTRLRYERDAFSASLGLTHAEDRF